MYYDVANDNIVFDATVMTGTYLANGFGTTMKDTDMIVWESNVAKSMQIQCYSTQESTPATVTHTYTTTTPVSN